MREAMNSMLDGYTITETDSERVPYNLHGPRGARYGLMRNVHDPEALFAVNLRSFGVVERLGWFREADVKARFAAQS